MMISLYLSLICTFAPTKWQWDSSSNPWKNDPIWTDYYPLDNDAIEKGFQDGLGKVPLSIGSYHVDLAHMKQTSNDLQRNRRVRRVEVGHHPKSIHVAKERVANEGRERDLEYFELICGKHMPSASDERLRKCAEEMLNDFISSGQLPFRFTSLLNGEWLMTDPKSNDNFTYVWKAQSDIQANEGHNKFKFVGKQTHHNGDLLDEPFTVYGCVEKPAQKIMWIVNGVQCEGRINFDGTITDGTYQKSSDNLNVQSQNEFFGRKLSEENSSSRKNNNTMIDIPSDTTAVTFTSHGSIVGKEFEEIPDGIRLRYFVNHGKTLLIQKAKDLWEEMRDNIGWNGGSYRLKDIVRQVPAVDNEIDFGKSYWNYKLDNTAPDDDFVAGLYDNSTGDFILPFDQFRCFKEKGWCRVSEILPEIQNLVRVRNTARNRKEKVDIFMMICRD